MGVGGFLPTMYNDEFTLKEREGRVKSYFFRLGFSIAFILIFQLYKQITKLKKAQSGALRAGQLAAK